MTDPVESDWIDFMIWKFILICGKLWFFTCIWYKHDEFIDVSDHLRNNDTDKVEFTYNFHELIIYISLLFIKYLKLSSNYEIISI